MRECCRHWIDKRDSPFWGRILDEVGDHRYHLIKFCPECGAEL